MDNPITRTFGSITVHCGSCAETIASVNFKENPEATSDVVAERILRQRFNEAGGVNHPRFQYLCASCDIEENR